jgi:hypothetical protein
MIKNMLIPWMLGTLSLIYTYKVDKKYLKIDFEAIKSFLIFMLWLTLFRTVLFFMSSNPIEGFLHLINPWLMLGVFWEDAVFVMPLIILKDKKNVPNVLYYTLFAISTAVFALGHSYQGIMGLTSAIYIYFSAKYGRQLGFGTVMICHTLYDLITYFGAIAYVGTR